MKVIAWLVAIVICAILYRLGGIGKPFNTKYRDLGIPAIITALLLILGFKAPWWVHCLHFGLLFGALTTYWDCITDKNKDNFYLHSFVCGLAAIVFAWCGVAWWLILIRAVVMSVASGVWCEKVGNDVAEETFRGGIIAVTIPMLLL